MDAVGAEHAARQGEPAAVEQPGHVLDGVGAEGDGTQKLEGAVVPCELAGKTAYDWQHYVPLLQRKPGALRNGAPFADRPSRCSGCARTAATG